MVPTLLLQAEQRRLDLLWQPAAVAETTVRLVERLRPDTVLVDHLCIAARLGLYAAGVASTTFVPGHPSQLPVAGECYGFPVTWPAWVRPDPAELAALRRCCVDVSTTLAEEASVVVRAIDPARPPIADVFGAFGADVLYNSPEQLRDPTRRELPDPHCFLGSCVRPAVPLDDDIARWRDEGSPYVYVSLGTFVSARADVLRRIAAALVADGRRVAMATGPTDPDELGALPAGWLLRPFLPQVELIASADSVVCHGGNNTVTEALTAGRPLLVLPVSTDQFCTAVDVERAGVGLSADPNRSSVGELAARLAALDDPAVRATATALGRSLTTADGPGRAAALLTASPV
jgi:UDP:flavonoid glycosyltransferase YjiC (YdhE family)